MSRSHGALPAALPYPQPLSITCLDRSPGRVRHGCGEIAVARGPTLPCDVGTVGRLADVLASTWIGHGLIDLDAVEHDARSGRAAGAGAETDGLVVVDVGLERVDL